MCMNIVILFMKGINKTKQGFVGDGGYWASVLAVPLQGAH